MEDCLFCKIGRKEIPAKLVYEDDTMFAFEDIHPQAPTHALLIPKEHIVASAADVDARHATLLAEIFTLAAHIARTEKLDGGWRLVTNVGPDAGQSVFHLHFHLLGGRAMKWPPG